MIFKSLFRPKYQHPDPKVRQAAIADLDPAQPEHKTQLHEMAFNDENLNVRLAALDRLDSFALWWKLAQTEKQERIHKRAQQRVEATLLEGQGESLSDKQRQTFVQECTNHGLLEKLLLQKWQHDEPALSQAILAKLNKASLRQRVMFESHNADLPLRLAELEQDEDCLQRMLRKHKDSRVVALARQKLEKLSQDKIDKQQLEKTLRLILAKLLALKDNQDYPLLCQQLDELKAQFSAYQQQLSELPQAINEEISQKYQDLCQKAERRAESVKQAWQQAEAEREAAELEQQLIAKTRSLLETLSSQDTALQMTDPQRLDFIQRIGQCRAELSHISNSRDTESLQNRLNQAEMDLQKLPALQQAVQGAKALLSTLQDVAVPANLAELNEAQKAWQEARGAYRALKRQFDALWPQSVQKDWQTLDKAWQNAIHTLNQEAKAQLNKVRGSLRKVQELVQTGKFHAAMSMYQRVQKWHQALPETEQDKVQRLFEQVREHIENLKEWQAYIAQPRKPALLEEIQALADKPLDAKAQADKVKQLRSQWNTLGKLDTEEDLQLNQAFDLACELAFAPVREQYALEQQRREANLLAKQGLLEQLRQLQAQTMDMDQLAKSLQSLQQQWRDVGDVDYRQLQNLNQQYRELCAPVKAKLQSWYQDNEAQKQRLIDKVQELLALDDINEATHQAKQLQESWKQVGRVRAKQERLLWDAFRSANDALFAKRNQEFDNRRQANQTLLSEVQDLLKQTELALVSLQNHAELLTLQEQTSEKLQRLLAQLDDKAAQQVQRDWQKVQDKFAAKADTLRQQQQLAKYELLFDVLGGWSQNPPPEQIERLPGSWRQAFLQPGGEQSRLQLLIKMELLRGQASATEDTELRREVQLQMMTDKLEQGETPDMDQLLCQWINQGPLSVEEQEQLPRLTRLFAPPGGI
ncbi:DUF349 domain-containing protein [Bowmanella denitrificans]|uniref:DUF349 domain-containing protein n=1 Tax=Bowmanella denitrificans TaxID=366582 RepID=UPI000C9C02B0|nr:DUF349 domain-containing protein [Bowmanella denitrificans]